MRGRSRRATTHIRGENRNKGIVQVTTWKDRKQVMFVHTHMVGSMDGETTLRQVKVQKNRSYIDFPPVAKDYAVNINGVDKSDRYGHNNSVTIRTNRCYLQIWFWKIEWVVHCVYIVVCYVANAVLRDDWNKYTSKHDGRNRFQIDVGIVLMEYGIRLDCGEVNYK